jgi:hypothetical protein
MSIFLESPWPAVCLGLVAEVVLGIMLWRTGRGVLLGAMGGVLVLALGGVLLAHLVVTDSKRIKVTLHEAAAAVEANDLARLNTYLTDDVANLRTLASFAMQRVTFTQVRLNKIELRIDQQTNPSTATAEIWVTVWFHDRKGEYPYESYPASGTVHLRRDGQRWLITNFITARENWALGGSPSPAGK